MLLHSSSASLTAGQWSVAVSGCVEWSSFWVCIYGQVSEKVVIENIECVQSKSPRPKAALARSHKVGLRFTPATREAGENRGHCGFACYRESLGLGTFLFSLLFFLQPSNVGCYRHFLPARRALKILSCIDGSIRSLEISDIAFKYITGQVTPYMVNFL